MFAKKCFIPVVIALMTVPCLANAQYFGRSYDLESDFFFTDAETSGYFWGVGYLESQGMLDVAWLVVDHYNVPVERYYIPGSQVHFTGSEVLITQVNDGHIIVGTAKSQNYPDFSTPFVIKIGWNGKIHWARQYEDNDAASYTIHDVASAYDPKAGEEITIIAGERHDIGNQDQDFWAMRIRSDGVVLWSNRYGNSGQNEIGTALDIDIDERPYTILLVGKRSYTDHNTIWALEIHEEGMMMKNAELLTDHFFFANAVKYDPHSSKDGTFVLVGDISNGTDYDVLVMKATLRNGFNLDWANQIEVAPNGFDDSGQDVVINGSTEYIVVGMSEVVSPANFTHNIATIFHLDAAQGHGTGPQPQIAYSGNTGDEEFTSISLITGGLNPEILVAGSTQSFQQNSPYRAGMMLNLDIDGLDPATPNDSSCWLVPDVESNSSDPTITPSDGPNEHQSLSIQPISISLYPQQISNPDVQPLCTFLCPFPWCQTP